MSKGLGRTQRECLRSIERRTRASTFTIAADVYAVEPDRNDNRTITDAQHIATKRALTGLRRMGLVAGSQDMSVVKLLRDGNYDPMGRAERCCIWTLVRRV
jgi:hypothetical protein